MSTDLRTVLITAPDAETAELLAAALVEERLAACASIVPGVVSIYRWEGEVHRDDEVLLVVKTTAARSDALRERVVALHPYDVPEVLALAVDGAHDAYGAWLRTQVEVAS